MAKVTIWLNESHTLPDVFPVENLFFTVNLTYNHMIFAKLMLF